MLKLLIKNQKSIESAAYVGNVFQQRIFKSSHLKLNIFYMLRGRKQPFVWKTHISFCFFSS